MSVGRKTPPAQNADSLYNQALQLLHREHQPEEALVLFRRAAELAPSDAVQAGGVGEALSALQRYPEAVEAFDRSIALDPRYLLPYCNKGVVLLKLGRFEDACECLMQGHHVDPHHAAILYNLACAWCLRGDRENSLSFLEKALAHHEKYYRLAPEDPELAPLLGDPAFQALLIRK